MRAGLNSREVVGMIWNMAAESGLGIARQVAVPLERGVAVGLIDPAEKAPDGLHGAVVVLLSRHEVAVATEQLVRRRFDDAVRVLRHNVGKRIE